MFSFLKNAFTKIYHQFTAKIGSLFAQSTVDESTLHTLEVLLLSSDVGVSTTRRIITQLRTQPMQAGADLYHALKKELLTILREVPQVPLHPVIVLVGINGSGKTTCAGKLVNHFKARGKRVLLVAADTFRAAASEQLEHWAQATGTPIVRGNNNQDPAAVVYAGCDAFTKDNFDYMIIDTAGRLHTKTNLMNELAKIKRTITKKLPHTPITTLLTIDSMLGQNSFEQAKLFKECTDVDGIILTKMDGTGKGGIVFAIATELHIPISYMTFGEQLDDIAPFDAAAYVDQLLDTV